MRLKWYSVPLTRYVFKTGTAGLEPATLCLYPQGTYRQTLYRLSYIPKTVAITLRSQEATPAGIEPASPDRQSGVLTVIFLELCSKNRNDAPSGLF